MGKMATIRLMPGAGPRAGAVNGRSYPCPDGQAIDVPDYDAFVLMANGWVRTAGSVGSTAVRPTNPKKGDTFHDTDVGVVLLFDGKNWRRTDSNASV